MYWGSNSIAFPDNDPAFCWPVVVTRACRLPRPTTTRSDEDGSLSPINVSDIKIDLSKLTIEQLAVVFVELSVGEVLKVVAFADTAKTRCLTAYSEQHPIEKFSTSQCVHESKNICFPQNRVYL